MTLIKMFRELTISMGAKSAGVAFAFVMALAAGGNNLHAQELVTNGDFENGLSGWTGTAPNMNNGHVVNNGTFSTSCAGTFTSFVSPQPIAGMGSVAYDQATIGSGQLISDPIMIPDACSSLDFSLDLEHESSVPLNAGSQDVSIVIFDSALASLGSLYSLTGSGSAQIQVPAQTITISNFSTLTGSGSGLLNSLAGQTVSIAVESVADDGCLAYQFDNLSLVCQDPLAPSDFSLTDPCACDNPDNIILADGTYLFHDILVVDAPAGQTIMLYANDGNLIDASQAAIPIGTVFTEVSPGVYNLEFYTLSGVSADIQVSSGFGAIDFTSGGCNADECNDSCPVTPACNDNVQVSLDTSCEAVFFPSLILEGDQTNCPFQVRILSANDNIISSSVPNGGSFIHPSVDASFIGSIWKAEVYYINDNGAEVSCWGSFTVEDKLAPQLTCAPDITVSCKDNVTIDVAELEAIGLNENCEEARIIILSDELDENDCGPDGISAVRQVTYLAQDQSGLTSETCSYQISYERVALADVEFPMNFTGECSASNTPGTDITGRPSVGGCDLSLSDNLCKFNISFTDDTTSTCGSNISIRRRWVVLDWCAAEHRTSYQTIEISDTEPPVLTCPQDITVDATEACSGTFTFNPFGADDLFNGALAVDCSTLSFDAGYLLADDRNVDDVSDEFIPMSNIGGGAFRATLPGGQNWIRYEATDACGNMSECRMELFVQDNAPPHAVCDQFTVVSLADNGWGRLRGISLDDGSFDQCGGPVTFEVRRESTPCASDALNDRDDTEFGPYVQFCCTEANETIRVEMKVIDESGLSSTCVVNVVVQDKFNNFDLGCPTPMIIPASCNSNLAAIKNLYGSPNPSNTCGSVPSFTMVDDDSGLGDCGAGTITRTWTAVGQSGTCVQRISISEASTLSFSSFIPPVENATANCTNFMEDLGDGPRLRDANVCSDVGITFEDNPFFNVEGYCVKVIRTWTAIDFCSFNSATGEGSFEWTQTIKVSDTTGPVIDAETCPTDITVTATAPNCNALISIPMPAAADACTGDNIPASRFSWDISGTGLSGVGNTLSEILDIGSYTVTWTATGVCGAEVTSNCTATVTVEDLGRPTPYCRSSVIAVVTGDNTGAPRAEVSADDFDLGSEDDCGGNLTVSFSSTDASDTQRVFECHQLGFHTLEIYFTDSSGNQDFCVSSVNVQANGDVCDTIGQRVIARVEGDVYTEENQMVHNVEIGLQAMINNQMNFQHTDTEGHFAFDNISTNADYRIQAAGQDDYLNGVSTLDLIMIQRHILGIESLDSPYKLLAADVNNNQVINGLDLVELRKLILGIYIELPQNDSWRFVNEAQDFENIESPWPFEENIELYQLAQDEMENDFIAVKIGDVNGSAVVNQGQPAGKPVSSGLKLVSELHSLGIPNQYLIPVYLSENTELYGLQMNLNLGSEVRILDVESGRIEMDNGHSILRDGQLALSYSQESLFEISDNEALFYVTVESDNPLNDKVLGLNNKTLSGEVYKENYVVEQLNIGDQLPTFVAKLYQNSPNPFSGETVIEFELPVASDVNMKIISLKGRIIKEIQGSYEAGRHSIKLTEADLTRDNVYYYQLETENYTETRKMVRVK